MNLLLFLPILNYTTSLSLNLNLLPLISLLQSFFIVLLSALIAALILHPTIPPP